MGFFGAPPPPSPPPVDDAREELGKPTDDWLPPTEQGSLPRYITCPAYTHGTHCGCEACDYDECRDCIGAAKRLRNHLGDDEGRVTEGGRIMPPPVDVDIPCVPVVQATSIPPGQIV